MVRPSSLSVFPWLGKGLRILLIAVFFVLLSAPYFPATAQQSEESGGNRLVGPHEAGQEPKIGGLVDGLPMTIILVDDWPSTWKDKLPDYASSIPQVIRIDGQSFETPLEEARRTGELVAQLGLAEGTIVTYGNEENNLDLQWRSFPSPRVATDAELREAGQKYAELFLAFKEGLGGAPLRVAPSTVDPYNYYYAWEPWAEGASAAYAAADVLVANLYNLGDDGLNAHHALEEKVGKKVAFVTEFGPDPFVTLEEYLEFYETHNPPDDLLASALIPNKCKGGELGNLPEEDPWLYYIAGKLYDENGKEIIVTSGNNCEGIESTTKPVFIFPKSEDQLRKYLANTQVYCAPPQVYEPVQPTVLPGNDPCQEGDDQGLTGNGLLGNLGNNRCEPDEYNVVNLQDKWSTKLTFPLFRNDSGGISIESDLSRVKPGEDIFDAFKRNTRADYAPQFYLSTPETQCLSAVRYVNHVQKLCNEFGSPEKCAANISFEMPKGGSRKILDGEVWSQLNNESICSTFAVTDVAKNTERAQMVASIQPYTPKVFKLGFLVQHIKMGDEDGKSILAVYLQEIFNGWFAAPNDPNRANRYQEKVELVPIWYNSGLTASEYDQYQANADFPYTIDPDTYLAQIDKIDPKCLETKSAKECELEKRAENYAGPLWRTYAAVLPEQTHQEIWKEKIRTVLQNYRLMLFMEMQVPFGGSGGFSVGGIKGFMGSEYDKLGLNLEGNDYGAAFRCEPAEACLCFSNDENPENDICLNQTKKELKAAFPIDFTPDDKYLESLKKEVLLRINAGRQETGRFPQDEGILGPTSIRTFDPQLCELDPEDSVYGVSEETGPISSKAQQELKDKKDPDGDPKRAPITQVVSELRAKIMAQGGNKGLLHERAVRNYLVLPDESMNIEILQAYVAPMFLSPEMYADIMSGQNTIWPFVQEGNNPDPYLSAFLRTEGPARTLVSGEEGYMKTKRAEYARLGICSPNPGVLSSLLNQVIVGDTNCRCGDLVREEVSRGWIPYDEDYGHDASPETGCVAEKIDITSLVDVKPTQQGAKSNSNPQTPGQLFALNEFLRRMAFTPEHMQTYEEYPGLAQFYGGEGATISDGQQDRLDSVQTATQHLSGYFKAFMDGIDQSYSLVKPAQKCGYTYVSQSDANSYAKTLRTIFTEKGFLEYMNTTGPYAGKNAQIFGNCGGKNCVSFITDITTSVPICDGSVYMNPYIAYSVAVNETAGLQNDVAFHYGCVMPAWNTYKPEGRVNGIACTVEVGTGETVINPAIIAQVGQTSTQVATQCIENTAQSTRLNRFNAEDGLACFISTIQGLCSQGVSDTQSISDWGYGTPLFVFERVSQDLRVFVNRYVATGRASSQFVAAAAQLQQDIDTLKNKADSCY